MQQTPIQELINRIKEKIIAGEELGYDNNHEGMIQLHLLYSLATSLLPTEQQYIQQHAEGFAEWVDNTFWFQDLDTRRWWNSDSTSLLPENITTSELYTKYIEYINSLK